jgi:hypothetical protein
MTNQGVLIQILHEVTGRSKKEVRLIVEVLRFTLSDRGQRFDEELTPTEAEDLLTQLRAEKDGILSWLVSGARDAYLETMPTSKNTH